MTEEKASDEVVKSEVGVAESTSLRPVDQIVLEILRREPGLTVPDLMARLEVTATAVRHRVDRLVDLKFLERRKQSVGRGRPTFRHFLTPLGWREVGSTYVDLALAMWSEFMAMDDVEARSKFLHRVSERMGKSISEQIPKGSFKVKLDALVHLLRERKIPASVGDQQSLPVLEVHACPYPDLASEDGDRTLCELEAEVFSEALGVAIELSQCRLDGHGCCQFRQVSPGGDSARSPDGGNPAHNS